MNEIEFLPAWYRNGKRREFGYRTQYVALVGTVAVMIVWSIVNGRSVSQARDELASKDYMYKQALTYSSQLEQAKTDVAKLEARLKSLEKIDARINLPAVIAEISFLLDNRVVLKRVQLIAEKFARPESEKKSASGAVRVANMQAERESELPVGNVKFKVVINGLAVDSGDVAELICHLEDSPWFDHVVPSFSRDTIVLAEGDFKISPAAQTKLDKPDANKIPASEFEITCYMANFSLE